MLNLKIHYNNKIINVGVEETDAAPNTPSTSASNLAAPVCPPAAPEVLASTGVAFTLNAPMPGRIASLYVERGQRVEKDDLLLILETMKIENSIFSEYSGTVSDIKAKVGDLVEAGQVILEFTE